MRKFPAGCALAALVAAFALVQTAFAADAPGIHRSPSPEGARVGFDGLADGSVVPPTFSLKFTVDGMGISPAGTDVPNTGHHHLLVDVADLPDPNLPLPMSEHILHFGKGQTETELTLPEGEHTLQLVFADYAHIPHDPVVASGRIRITVSSAAPEPRD